MKRTGPPYGTKKRRLPVTETTYPLHQTSPSLPFQRPASEVVPNDVDRIEQRISESIQRDIASDKDRYT